MAESDTQRDDHTVCERCEMQKTSVDDTGRCLVCRDYLKRGR